MRIQFIGAAAEPAHAEKGHFSFQVYQPVGCPAVLRREGLEEVVANRLVCGLVFGEAAHALRYSHAIAFRW
jgi:hypothetical protein